MVYTKTGDGGTTSLVGGKRVKKCDPRVESYGTVDELNSHVGLLAEYARPVSEEIYAQLKAVQDDLFSIQTLLATEDEALYAKMPQIGDDDIRRKVHPCQQVSFPDCHLQSASVFFNIFLCDPDSFHIIRKADLFPLFSSVKTEDGFDMPAVNICQPPGNRSDGFPHSQLYEDFGFSLKEHPGNENIAGRRTV